MTYQFLMTVGYWGFLVGLTILVAGFFSVVVTCLLKSAQGANWSVRVVSAGIIFLALDLIVPGIPSALIAHNITTVLLNILVGGLACYFGVALFRETLKAPVGK